MKANELTKVLELVNGFNYDHKDLDAKEITFEICSFDRDEFSINVYYDIFFSTDLAIFLNYLDSINALFYLSKSGVKGPYMHIQ